MNKYLVKIKAEYGSIIKDDIIEAENETKAIKKFLDDIGDYLQSGDSIIVEEWE